MGVARDAAVGTDPGQAPLNTLRHAQALPPIGAANPLQPSLDTLDSTGWLDVGSEPVIVSLPDSHGRYVDARVLDMWTNVVWSTSSQFATARGGHQGASDRVRRPGLARRFAQGREARRRADPQCMGERAYPVERRARSDGGPQAAARDSRRAAERLYGRRRAAPSIAPPRSNAADAAAGASGTPAAQVAALDANGFFSRLAHALPDNPPTPADPHALNIPLRPRCDARRAGEAAERAATRSRRVSPTVMSASSRAPSNLLTGNGWSWFGDGVGNYGPDYALRAYAAYAQPGIGTKDDEVRAVVTQDSDGHRAERREPLRDPLRAEPVAAGARLLVDHRVHEGRRIRRKRAGASGGRRPQWRAPQSRRLARRDRVVHARAGAATGCRRRAPICNWCCVCTRRSRKPPTAAGNRRPSCVNEMCQCDVRHA